MGDANSVLWFDLVDGQYVGRFDIKQRLVHDPVDEVFHLHEADGSVVEFHDFDQTGYSQGLFKRKLDAAGNTLEVTSYSSGEIEEVQRQTTVDGLTTIESFLYQYEWYGRLSRVVLRRKVGGGSWQNVEKVEYTYYTRYDEAYGLEGDLKLAEKFIFDDNDQQWKSTGATYYRYYDELSGGSGGSGSGGAGDGNAHLLKYVVEPDCFERLKADPDVTDPFDASDEKVAEYADHYFQYDDQRRVVSESVHGGTRTFAYQYTESTHADGCNNWKYKTVETLPGGDQTIVYTNHAAQPMLKILKSGDDQWYEFTKFDSSTGRPIWQTSSSAVSGYDEQYADLLNYSGGSYQYLKDNDGLIRVTEYDSASGNVSAEKVQHGVQATPVTVREHQYTSHSEGEATVYLPSKTIEYPDESDPNHKVETSFAYTFHAGTVQVKKRTTTLPAIPTEQNGSGVAAQRVEVFDTHGNLTWTLDERGFVTCNVYDVPTGALVQRIDGVDMSQVSDAPAGWETLAISGLHAVTDLEHDTRGRTVQVLGPERKSSIMPTK